MTSHSGPVIGIVALRTHPILITAGHDGAIMAYNTETHTLLARYKFPAAISCLLYPPLDVSTQMQFRIFTSYELYLLIMASLWYICTNLQSKIVNLICLYGYLNVKYF